MGVDRLKSFSSLFLHEFLYQTRSPGASPRIPDNDRPFTGWLRRPNSIHGEEAGLRRSSCPGASPADEKEICAETSLPAHGISGDRPYKDTFSENNKYTKSISCLSS